MASLPPPGGKPTMMRIGRSSDAQAVLSPVGSHGGGGETGGELAARQVRGHGE